MVEIIKILIFVFFYINLSYSDDAQNITDDMRIVGGVFSEVGDFPSLVSLQLSNYRHFCGGNIVDEYHVLTAAHCLFNHQNGGLSRYNVQIMAGDNSLSFQEQSRTRIYRRVGIIFIHPNYNGEKYHNDIALIRLNVPVAFHRGVISPVHFARELAPALTQCEVAGWGRLAYGDLTSPLHQRKVKVAITTERTCRVAYSNYFEEALMFCAGQPNGGKDACQGDSGGGLYCNGRLHGLVSFGFGCGNKKYPGVYTKVPQYMEWINDCMRFRGDSSAFIYPFFVSDATTLIFSKMKIVYWLCIIVLAFHIL